MKNVFAAVLFVVLGLAFSGCSSTTDKGVNISRPMDVFGVAPATSAPATNSAFASLAQAQG